MICLKESQILRGGERLPQNVLILASTGKFFLADENGIARRAADNPTVFSTLLTEEIQQTSGWLATYLQNALNELNASLQPPAPPRYPQAGDHCTGSVIWCSPSNTVQFGHLVPIYVGRVQADITANNFDTPPAYTRPPIQFAFTFTGLGAVPFQSGDAVAFDIAQAKYALIATNVVAA